MTTFAFVDARAGCAGDMFLGALVDAGLDVETLQEVAAALGLDHVRVSARAVEQGPLAATKVDVAIHGEIETPDTHLAQAADASHGHRTLAEILNVVRSATALPEAARQDAERVFGRLAEAEARVHGRSVDEVHFHEVGAADALVDVVGTCVGLRRLGVEEVRVGPLPWSTGEIVTAHGALPLPPPAVAHLLEGHPTFPGETREQVTPTGAALVAALSRGTTIPAGFVPRRTGHGAGSQAGERLPNVVRLILGDTSDDETPVDAVLLEANLDDATGQEAARALDRALEAGALDAWSTAVTMKKGRPGLVLSVLVRPAEVERIERILFEETPTLGVRRHAVARTVLPRRHVEVPTPYGPVRVKVRETPTGPAATPEHDDCLRLAKAQGVALARVLDAARAAWQLGQ